MGWGDPGWTSRPCQLPFTLQQPGWGLPGARVQWAVCQPGATWSLLYSVVAPAKASRSSQSRFAFKIEVSCEIANNSLPRVLRAFTGI